MEREIEGETERSKQIWKEGRQSEGVPALSVLPHQHGARLQSHQWRAGMLLGDRVTVAQSGLCSPRKRDLT